MVHTLQLDASPETHTISRDWSDTETPKQIIGVKQPNHLKLSEWDLAASGVNILRLVSGDKEHRSGPSRFEAFLASSPLEQTDAMFEAPGAERSTRFWGALPVFAPAAPCEALITREVMAQFLSCDIIIVPQPVRSPASTQVELSADEWMAQVRAWASSFPQRDHVVDDSRESIYGDRV